MEKMDEILVLQDGRIAERGKHQDLVHLNGLYNFFLQTQNGIR
jgi:ABC-type multidrug transport system fused ATPase/permease subunit